MLNITVVTVGVLYIAIKAFAGQCHWIPEHLLPTIVFFGTIAATLLVIKVGLWGLWFISQPPPAAIDHADSRTEVMPAPNTAHPAPSVEGGYEPPW